MDVIKLVNYSGSQIFYLTLSDGAIEVSITNIGYCINYLGSDFYKRISAKYASFVIKKDDNEDVYNIFDKLYLSIKEHYMLLKSTNGMNNLGKDALNVMNGDKMVWLSDDVPYGNVNKLIIEPDVEGYRISFIKGNYLDGRNNRSFKVKVNGVFSRYQPFNGYFSEFYRDLMLLDNVEKRDQQAYNLSKVVNE